MEPPKRLGSEAEAKAWLDGVVALYAQHSSITLSSASPGGSSGSGGRGAVMNSEEFLKFQTEQYQFTGQQIELYARYLKKDSRAGDLKYDTEKANSIALQAHLDTINHEHSNFYIDGILPAFNALKARQFNSSWNWAQQDALLTWYDIILKLWKVVQSQQGISEEQVSQIKDLYDSVINSLSTKGPKTKLKMTPQPRARRASSQFLRPQVPSGPSISEDKIPLLHLKRRVGAGWEYSSNLTGVYLDILNKIATSGASFKDKNALLTGVTRRWEADRGNC